MKKLFEFVGVMWWAVCVCVCVWGGGGVGVVGVVEHMAAAVEAMGHAFITPASSFHQLLGLPRRDPHPPATTPSVPEVSVTWDNMSPRWGAGGKPHAHHSSNDYLIRLFTLDLKEERGTKWRLLPICSTQGKKSRERERGRERERVGGGGEWQLA